MYVLEMMLLQIAFWKIHFNIDPWAILESLFRLNAKLVSSRCNSFVDYSLNIHLHGNSHHPGHLCVLEKVST